MGINVRLTAGLALGLLGASGTAYAEPAHAESERDEWYIGFSLGTGVASFTVDDKSRSYSEYFDEIGLKDAMRLGINFEVGATITPKLLVGFETAAMAQIGAEMIGDVERKVQLQHSQYLASATYFPMEKGLFLKAGAGLSRIVLLSEVGQRSLEVSESGFGGSLGAGYALWMGESFNMLLANDFHMATFSGGDGAPQGGWFNLTRLGFYWY